MSIEQAPEWDLADRMRKSLRHSGLDVQGIAEYLGVSRTSVSNWINGRIHPSKQTLRLWAIRCGVPFDWLTGESREVAQSGRVVRKSAFPVLAAAA